MAGTVVAGVAPSLARAGREARNVDPAIGKSSHR
jgi:hypothetical protein